MILSKKYISPFFILKSGDEKMERIKTPFDFEDIDDYIKYIDELYNNKKKNNYDDESLSHSGGRNTHNDYFDER